MREVVLTTPTEGWSATIHVADAPGATSPTGATRWPPSRAPAPATPPSTSTPTGRYVLIWITDLGGRTFELQEAVVRGR